MSKLIILRGPSGAGKSTVAKELFGRAKAPVVLIEQDHYRFIFKPAGGLVNSKTIHRMIKANVLIALEDGYDVILEGIFNVSSYKATFDEIFAVHKTGNCSFMFDVSFDETLRRHRTKPNKDQWSEADMKDWYHPKDYMGYDFEHIITETVSACETVNKIRTITGM
ncbi:MAG TPA: AAA family ATPase [Candidatus Saccharimonadales bacterium]